MKYIIIVNRHCYHHYHYCYYYYYLWRYPRQTHFSWKNGTRVIDYLICDQCTFLNVANFVVKQPSYLSDHSALVPWLNLNTRLIGDEMHTPNSSNRYKFKRTTHGTNPIYGEKHRRCEYLLRKRYENSN